MFKTALVRKPSPSYSKGQTTSKLGVPEIKKALKQHAEYCEALIKCGLRVIEMEPEDSFPDSTFVEDAAVVIPEAAIITRPGHETRRGEEKTVANKLKELKNLHFIKSPGTLDGGDILQAENHFFIGLSDRTNLEGARQLSEYLSIYNYTSSNIPVGEILHLKSGINYIGDNNMVMMERLLNLPQFSAYNKIPIIESETYAANCVLVNNYLIIASGFIDSKNKFIKAGYNIIELDVSEYEKMDGGLSCLSLRF